MSDTFPKTSAISLGRHFLDSLAKGLVAKFRTSGPVDLRNAVIILPTEEARSNLLRNLIIRAESEAIVLPRTYTISENLPCQRPHKRGDLDCILPSNMLPNRLPIPLVSRELLLGRLIFQWRKAHDHTNSLSLSQCLKVAPTLGSLFDELQAFNINYLALGKSSTLDDAAHWASIDKFLKIIIEQWPRILVEQSWEDPIKYDQLITKLVIQYWEKEPPKYDVIAAGFTGKLPHVVNLLSSIVSLPRGHVVVPSLDRSLGKKIWENLPTDHPQSTIKCLLDGLKFGDKPVPEWPDQGGHSNPTLSNISRLPLVPSILNEGDMPNDSITDKKRITDLTLITSQNVYSESQTIALIVKEFLTHNQGDVSVIAEDQILVKQVALQLRKWNLDLCYCTPRMPDASGGATFLQLVAEMICSDVSPVSLLSALKHPMCKGHTSKTLFNNLLNQLELKSLRGIRPEPGFSGILASLALSPSNQKIIAWLRELDRASHQFSELVKNRRVSLRNLLRAHLDFSTWLCQPETINSALPWDTDSDHNLYQNLNALCSTLKNSFTVNGTEYSDIFKTLVNKIPDESTLVHNARIYTYSAEQTLFSSSSLHILAGMNEGTWPSISPASRWLSPQMREALGLPGKEAEKADSALQLCQAFTAPKVVLTRSKLINGVQTMPSYHFAQIERAAKKADLPHTIDQSSYWNELGQHLEQETINVPKIQRPAPIPPVSARPRTLSATQIELWMQDPYSIFVSTILKIRALRPLDAKVGPPDYGRIVHEALEKFTRTYPKDMPQDAFQKLLGFGQDSFRKIRVPSESYAFWWPRFERLAQYFVDQECEGRRHISRAYTEISGAITVNLASGQFTLTTRADRINMRTDGKVDIIDYKTGMIPTASQIMDGRKPQLLLEALIALDHGFHEINTRKINSISSIQLSGAAIAGTHQSIEQDIQIKANELLSRVTMLIKAFDDENTPYYFVPHKDFSPQHNEFEHLARMKEWLTNPQTTSPEE